MAGRVCCYESAAAEGVLFARLADVYDVRFAPKADIAGQAGRA